MDGKPPETHAIAPAILNWRLSDPENRMMFKGGKYTDVNARLSFLCGLLSTGIIFGGLSILRSQIAGSDAESVIYDYTGIFLDRGITPYFIIFFSFWSLSILWLKSMKLRFQAKSFSLDIVPKDHDFVLTTETAEEVLHQTLRVVDHPRHFVLLSRIERALSNLHNLGDVMAVSEVLRSQAQNDEDHMESSYALLRGFIWAIPVLGFIGTVLGLSGSIGNLGKLLGSGAETQNVAESLIPVTANLSVAFDTTLLALICSLIVHLLMTQLKKKEEAFLDECSDKTHDWIISRLRLSEPEGA